VAPGIIPVFMLSLLPVTRPPGFVIPDMRAMKPIVMFSVRLPMMVKTVTPVLAVAGMPPVRMSAVPVIVCSGVVISAAQDNRVSAVGMGGRRAAQQQAGGEQGKLKQGTGFHERDSFSGYVRKQ
jgi:hypothetical protein